MPLRLHSRPQFPRRLRLLRGRLPSGLLLPAALIVSLLQPSPAIAQRLSVQTRAEHSLATLQTADAGTLPGSTPLTLTLHLRQTPAQTSGLVTLLAAQADSASPLYHQWLTPAGYAARFGLPAVDLATLRVWLEARGLHVTGVSAAASRLTVSGSASAAQTAFAVPLHRVAAGGAVFFANTAAPSLAPEIASFVSGISGLDDLPSVAAAHIRIAGSAAAAVPRALAHTMAAASPDAGAGTPAASLPVDSITTDPLASLAALVDEDLTPVVTLASTACLSELSSSEIAEYQAILRQANAQGITIVASSACAANASAAPGSSRETPSFPGSLAELTAVTPSALAAAAPAITSAEDRPVWQAAPGLPADTLRHEPDLTTPSLAALAETLTTLTGQLGHRVGNINATLYALAKSPGLFTQPDAVTTGAGNWETATGLGSISLSTLLKVFPHGVNSTGVSLVSSSYAINYGDTFTLTAKVLPNSYGNTGPTGTVTFTSSTQGVLGSSGIDGSGTATLTPDTLPVGVYSVTAQYSGDASYSGAASTSKVTITISIVNARLTATLSPSTNVPYGSTGTVTATVALPGANAAPSGPVMAQLQGSTGTVFTATLSPNPGGNTATANIVVSVPPPGSYTLQVTCQGNTNYQCQTPVNLALKTVKGYTNTAVAVTPADPQAGQPVTLTAAVTNAGNGTGTYTYGGSVSFYDSGKLLATAPVATNQATISLSLAGNRTHNITATYTGDTNWNTSTANAVAVTPTILPDAVTLASSVSGSNSLAGVNIIFTGTTTTTITYGRGPTGTITFFDTFNGAVVQLGNPATLVSNGPTASIGLFTSTGLLPGTHHIYAQYSGDDNYASATSAVLVLSLSDFSVTMTPTSLALAQGKGQAVSVFVGESGGFTGTVSLGCTPPSSSLSTCSFAPASVTGGGATTLTITTTAASALGRPATAPGLWSAAGGGVSLATLFLLLRPHRRRHLPALLAVLFAAGLLSANLGCGLGVTANASSSGQGAGGSSGSGGGSSSTAGTPLGTQNFTITAAGTDGTNTIRHTYQFQVTVQ